MTPRFLYPFVFGSFLLLCALWLIPRAWYIRALALDSEMRANVPAHMRSISDAHGWPLSDISLLEIQPKFIRILHRTHMRGPDPKECFVVRFGSTVLHECPTL